MNKPKVILILILTAALISGWAASAQELDSTTFSSGGRNDLTGGSYSLIDIKGQSPIGIVTGGPMTIQYGGISGLLFSGQSEFTFSSNNILVTTKYGDPPPASQNLTITNTGSGFLNYTVTKTARADWLEIVPAGGAYQVLGSGQTQNISLNFVGSVISGLAPGVYSVDLLITAPLTRNSPQTVRVRLEVLPSRPGDTEPPPAIKLWFNNRFYQQKMVESEGYVFIIPDLPALKIKLTIETPYTISQVAGANYIILDEGTIHEKKINIKESNISRVYLAGTKAVEGMVAGMDIEYTFDETITAGPHTFTIYAKSSGYLAQQSTGSLKANVEVMGGPLRLIGEAITYPSPFDINKDKNVTIQYTLSSNGNIDIYLVNVGGERIKKMSFMAGQEGGTAGANKVVWDGVSDQGGFTGNAIYLGTIVARDEGRVLGKVKLTVFTVGP